VGLSSGALACAGDLAPALLGQCRTACDTDLFIDPATFWFTGFPREAAFGRGAARRASLCRAGDVPRLRRHTRAVVPWVRRELARGRWVLAVPSPTRLYFGRVPSLPGAASTSTGRSIIALVRLTGRPDWDGLRRAVAAVGPDALALELSPKAVRSNRAAATAGWVRRQARRAAARLGATVGMARVGNGGFIPLGPLPVPPAHASPPPSHAEWVAEPTVDWQGLPLVTRGPEGLGANTADALVAVTPDAAALPRIVGTLAVDRSTPVLLFGPETTQQAFVPGPGPRLDLPLALRLSRLSPWMYRSLATAVVACRRGRLDGAGRVAAAGGGDGAPAAAVLLAVSGRPPLQTLSLERIYLPWAGWQDFGAPGTNLPCGVHHGNGLSETPEPDFGNCC